MIPTYVAEASSDTIQEANRRYLIRRIYCNTYHAADKALRKIFLGTVPLIYYLEAITHDTLGFEKCTSLDILYYIWGTYGNINYD